MINQIRRSYRRSGKKAERYRNFQAQTEGQDLIVKEAKIMKHWERAVEARARRKGCRQGATLV